MVQQLLFAGQILVVGLIYLFVWRVIASARRDLAGRAQTGGAAMHAQESTIISASDAQAARRSAGLSDPRIIVVQSDVLRAGVPFTIGGGLSIGRSIENDVVLDEGMVSGQHARIVAPNTVVDSGSTNGTLVNAKPIAGRVALRGGDVVQIGSTVFRFEVPR